MYTKFDFTDYLCIRRFLRSNFNQINYCRPNPCESLNPDQSLINDLLFDNQNESLH